MKHNISIEEIKNKFNIPTDDELVIENYTHQNINTSEWYVVPFNWEEPRCPTAVDSNTWIEMQYRDGKIAFGQQRHVNFNWRQEGDENDIVQYRFINQ